MKAPKGMKWINVTYQTERDGCIGEACMQLLIAEDAALHLLLGKGGPLRTTGYMYDLEQVLRGREMLCCGIYVNGSALVTPIEV